MNKYEILLIAAMSAVVHYQEYIDTGESLDLGLAQGAVAMNAKLTQWAEDNEVLLPLRRDHKPLFEALTENKS